MMTLTIEQGLQIAKAEALGAGPFFLNRFTADRWIAEYGQLPRNFKVIDQLALVVRPAPKLTFAKPHIRGAQWKRERAGRRL